ncbi:PepSY-associated TM helix domain-containing protein [Neptunitalea lumnitzerae]|uniref:Membrane protein n=1 Tax=Neptunitalea lumnitzerae TaxID=2965509 RepID=A0ABQ5MFT4_9FLAO|nr:PepSY-associated TM helix domain-containing protein [Neptunitalea sp. Y10]GLB48217.1 membrane protein [Neptunitalea sp. Y10]
MKQKVHKKKKGKSTFNKVVAWIHLWPSIVSGIIVVFVCITGTIIVYTDEIMDLSAGEAKYVTPGEHKLTYSEINEKVLQQDSMYAVSEAVFYKEPNRSLRLRIFDRKNVKMFMMYVNPYTGEILKKDSTIYFFFITAHLHAQLLAGSIGGWIVAISTIVFFVNCLTGLILWWPKKWNKTTKKASFTVKWSAKFKRLNYDLHNVFGFYSLLLCVILSGTGLIIFFHTLMDVTVKVAGGDELGIIEKLPKADSNKIPLDMAAFAYKTLDEKFPQKEAASIWVYQVQNLGAFAFTAGKPGLKSIEGDEIIAFDKYSGDQINLSEKTITHAKTENTVWQLHMGQWWGQLGKLLTFITGIIATSLPITGFIIWWGKRKKK